MTWTTDANCLYVWPSESSAPKASRVMKGDPYAHSSCQSRVRGSIQNDVGG